MLRQSSEKYYRVIIFLFLSLCLCSCSNAKKNIIKSDVMFCKKPASKSQPAPKLTENDSKELQYKPHIYKPGSELFPEYKKDAEALQYNPDIYIPGKKFVVQYVDDMDDNNMDYEEDFEMPFDRFYDEYSEKMGITFNGTENKDLLMAIDEWMGTPYLWGGCSIYGIDCSCLVKNIYEDVFGIKLNRTSLTMAENNLTPVESRNLKAGDILVFNMKGEGISHVGIYLKDNKFVHASLSRGVMISSLEQDYYKKRFVFGGRVKSSRNFNLAKLSIKDMVILDQ